ncbi:hypothetical protein [Leptospira weilii]|uniref:hypothetical protein n=1 Tax=Leptospira weilii TaxID=28184 RepID=UPI00031D43C1|nr:hypothetical protein [Leptospira weilii]
MAYGDAIKNRAYTLFLVGNNPEQIEATLKQDFPKLSSNTIRKWADTPDSEGMTWENRREEVHQVTRKRIQDEATNIRMKIKSDNQLMLKAVRDAFLSQAGAMIGNAKDPVSLGHLWRSFAADQIKYENSDFESIDLIKAGETLLELFMIGPKTKRAIDEEWATYHRKNLQKWYSEWTDTKEVQGTVIEEPKAITEKKV